MLNKSTLVWNKLGVWIRPGTGDEGIPGEQKAWQPMDLKDRTVLDIGGHIGCFAVYANQQGARNIVSIEPHPDNCEMYELNLDGVNNVELIEAAVVGSTYPYDTIPLWCTGRKGTATHSIYEFRGRKVIDVPTVTLELLLNEYNPSAVKIDIEGGEYNLLSDILSLFPKHYVEYVGVELHAMKPLWRVYANRFVSQMNKKYNLIVSPDISNDKWIGKIARWALS